MHYARCVGLAPTKPAPFLQQQGHIQEKQRTINQMPWMKQWCLWGERKISLFHTPRGPHQFLPPVQPKRKNEEMKKRRPTPGARKSKQRKKTGRKLKENKIVKLN